jgi:hypothetical protein
MGYVKGKRARGKEEVKMREGGKEGSEIRDERERVRERDRERERERD